ncbi:MBL fold metallo-hydrolase [Sphingobacterium yanglingense]|uniref:Glyoxylase-like metal-dependent hydrolase (Beta-lactamase superfamily II) n=1 Tax=Sphingobacterium yanglingense TaxID=1437280 RepID=A0A4R6W8D7_9SPHI|nr:MBL fold metallo-hydrolase [Sphingobacterium yanglingense]TDQ73329.1 glyoxylase-like metal-dependent hydrolase (beta-lactamase superfamily II) [Sphingobacterium yanglingense]
MINIETITFNPYQENTYILFDDKKNCAIIDPGMHTPQEEQQLESFINTNELKPQLLLNTHCHIDHVLGNHFVYEKWGLKPLFHEGEIPVLIAVQNYAPQMGFRYDPSPIPEEFLIDEQKLLIGDHTLHCILAPGHSPAHLCFYNAEQDFLIGGDVLFRNSIGRTDLPGGNHETLLEAIKKNIYTLPNKTIVYPGHGPTTTIAYEKETNPFIRG